MHTIADSLGVCVIALLTTPLELWAQAHKAVTGETITKEELMMLAERIRSLERLFNLKYGKGQDEISERLFTGEYGINREELNRMRLVYYSLRG